MQFIQEIRLLKYSLQEPLDNPFFQCLSQNNEEIPKLQFLGDVNGRGGTLLLSRKFTYLKRYLRNFEIIHSRIIVLECKHETSYVYFLFLM